MTRGGIKKYLIILIVIVAIAGASYYFFVASKTAKNQVAHTEEQAPDFSNVKTMSLVVTDLEKTKHSYTTQTDEAVKLSNDEQTAATLVLAAGKLVPQEKYELKKNDPQKPYSGIFRTYRLEDGLEKSDVGTILRQYEEVLKSMQGSGIERQMVGKPPTVTVRTTTDQVAPLATLRRATIIEHNGQESITYGMISIIKMGATLFVADFSTETEQQLITADADYQDMLRQIKLKID